MRAALAFALHRRQADVAHLREETLETVDGDRFQVAASPWSETKYARACHVAAGVEGRIFAVYSLWQSSVEPAGRLFVTAGIPEYEVTQAVLKRFRARLGQSHLRHDSDQNDAQGNATGRAARSENKGSGRAIDMAQVGTRIRISL